MAVKKKKAAAKKTASKKKVSAKKAASKKTPAKKKVVKKAASKKTVSKKATSKKAASKKSVSKKPVSKKSVTAKKPEKKEITTKPEKVEAGPIKSAPIKPEPIPAEISTPAPEPIPTPKHAAKQGFFARTIEEEHEPEPFEVDDDTGAQVNFVSEKKRNDDDILKHVSEALEQLKMSPLQVNSKTLRASEESTRFKELFGWDLPTELAAWLKPGLPEYALCSWDVDHFDLEEVLELEDEDDYIEFFQDIDQSLILFMGLMQAGQHSSGDEIYFDIGSYGNGFVNVVALNNEALSDHIESTSLSMFALKMKAENFTQIAEDFDQMFKEGEGEDWLKEHGVSSREDLGKAITTLENISQDMQQRYKLNVTPDLEQRYSILLKRIEWIRELLIEEECEHFAEKIAASPDMSVWKKERKQLKSNPQTLFYWLLAHYFFDNKKACSEAIKVAKKSGSAVMQGFADVIARLLEKPGMEMFGNIKAARVIKLKDSVLEHVNKAHRE